MRTFVNPQSNEVQAQFDILTSFRQGNRSMDEWYNAVWVQVNLAKYLLNLQRSFTGTFLWFFLRDEEFISRTISDGSVDLEKFLASKVQQLAKKIREFQSHHMPYKTSGRGSTNYVN